MIIEKKYWASHEHSYQFFYLKVFEQFLKVLKLNKLNLKNKHYHKNRLNEFLFLNFYIFLSQLKIFSSEKKSFFFKCQIKIILVNK